MNDIGLNDCGSKIVMFADDTVLLQTGQDPRVVSNVLEKDLVTLTKYFRSLNLILNVKKTKIINYDVRIRKVSNKQALFNNDIQVDGQKIETVEKFKYLGIVIDGRRQFDVQLNSTIRNVNSKLYLQSRIRRCINNNTALIIYKSMVLPYLEYASCFLVSFRLSDKAKLQRLQNKGLKIALSKDRLFSTDLLHTEARIAYWETKTKAALCRLIHKYKYAEEYVVQRLDTRLHDGPVFHVDKPKTEWYKRSTSFVCRNIWNSLPSRIRLMDDHDLFKRAVKNHFSPARQATANERNSTSINTDL